MRLNRIKVNLLLAKLLINQAVLADKAGISRQTMSAVMNGRNCRPELLGRSRKALGVDPGGGKLQKTKETKFRHSYTSPQNWGHVPNRDKRIPF